MTQQQPQIMLTWFMPLGMLMFYAVMEERRSACCPLLAPRSKIS